MRPSPRINEGDVTRLKDLGGEAQGPLNAERILTKSWRDASAVILIGAKQI
jgi:hypothetical protein